MESDSAAPLREMWYYAMPSRRLRPGRMVARKFLGEPLLFGRARDGVAFAVRDLCPHRGMPLSEGRFDGAEVQCPLHGWRFDHQGRCTAIPSLTADSKFDCSRLRVKAYKVEEVQGGIWVFFGDNPEGAADIPVLPAIGPDRQPDLIWSLKVDCSLDTGVFGQIDPSHNPFVHISWWWRRKAILEKTKEFVPWSYGFTTLPHPPSSNYSPYKLLGSPRTQLFFRLPGIRIEHTTFGKHYFVILWTVTPLDDGHIEMTYIAYWTPWFLTLLKPLLLWGARIFSFQDRDALNLQQEGLRYGPSLMLVDDADTQARWYFQLKREYRRALTEGRPFENPVKPRTLRFRS